ncbi:NACHT domain-containing protein [Streptomyces sp. NPDC126499]|uniref:NACHT domain-containing protein n=1 Tax=Streptomyces sp. NPDC126499 TaxID=3155314 RepID=UPI00331A97DD
MDPALIGTRLASAAIGPLLRKLLAGDGPGAGLPGGARKVRLSALVSFRGEKRTLTEKDVRRLAATLVERAATGPGEPPFPADETEAVADALASRLLALGDLDMDDVQAVRLGHQALAQRLRAAAPPPDGLATASVLFLDAVTEAACRHILEFFTQRSTFVARTLVEQSRGQAELGTKLDRLTDRIAHPDVRDADFERRYLAHLAKKHGRLTIYGIDLHHSPDEWPLDMAYLSLEATGPDPAGSDPHWHEAWYARRDPDSPHGSAVRTAGGPVRADLALARHPRILLRGLAGSGKTTLVQWLTVSAATSRQAEGMAYLHGRIPFVLPLRALTRHGERLPAAEHFLSAAGCPLTAPDGWVDRVLTAGRGLVLVDGIDEIPEAERGRARGWLRDLLAAYGDGNRWLVTSRPSAVGDDWLARDGFTELTLSPMTRTEVATFVRRWHQAAGPDAAPYEQPLLDALRTTEHVAQLATNPLMCGLICALHRDRRGYLPRGRKALYEAALSMLLARRDRERDMGTPYGIALDEAPQIQLIQRLAYWLTLNGRTQMDRDHARSIVQEAVPAVPDASAHDPEKVFTHLLHRSGLLREPTADTVDFVHRTFQDYLAAKALVDHWDIGVLVSHAADDQWEDVIRMAVGHARPRECAEILRELLAAADANPQDRSRQLRVLLLAASALDHATEVPPEVRAEVLARTAEIIPPRTPDEARELARVGRLVLDLLPGPEGLSDEEARMVVTTATHITVDAAIPYLARFADHSSLEVRSQLVWGWGRFEAKPYTEAIVARVDPTDLHYSVADDERAREVLRLTPLPDRLEILHQVSDEQTAALLARCKPRVLHLERTAVRPDLSALSSLTRVERLSLDLPDEARWRLADLPTRGPLESLAFSSWPVDGLAELAHCGSLDQLVLWDADLTAEGWQQLAALPRVPMLCIDSVDLDTCLDDIRLPGVDHLVLQTINALPSLDRIVRSFPALRGLTLFPGVEGTLEVSALAALPHLTELQVTGLTLTGAEHLPATLRIRA